MLAAEHGGEVNYVDWHPRTCLLASCSKDALVKLWDPRAGGGAKASLHGHKNGIKQVCVFGWGKVGQTRTRDRFGRL